MISVAEPQDGEVFVDMPSGGGYLRHYLNDVDVQLIAVETTKAFYDQCAEDDRTTRRLCDLADTGLDSNSVDAVVSMAGLHHVDDRPSVFAEVRRILRPGGRFCIADVDDGSRIDGFLNTFVDEHNSMGHTGTFIDERFLSDLREAGLAIDHDQVHAYTWDFGGEAEMVEYCTLMFGLDLASPSQVLEGIRAYQGWHQNGTRCRMNWALRFIRARR